MARTSKYGGLLEYPPKMYEEIERWVQGVNFATRRRRLEQKIADLAGDEDVERQIEILEDTLDEDDYDELLAWAGSMTEDEDEIPDFPRPGSFAEMSPQDREKAANDLTSWFRKMLKEKEKSNQDEIKNLEKKKSDLDRRIKSLNLDEKPIPGVQSREFGVDLEDWRQAKNKKLVEKGKRALPKINVHFIPAGFDLGIEPTPGSWSSKSDTIYIRDIPGADWRQTLRHELRHMGQTLLSRATGHDSWEGEVVPKSRPAPGMPSKRMMDREVQQRYRRPHDLPSTARQVAQRLKRLGIEGDVLHALDDVEFYTRLADSVERFQNFQKGSDWSPTQTRTALGIFTGAIPAPERPGMSRQEKNEAWKKLDPDRKIRGRVPGTPDSTFAAWKKHNKKKWKKGAKELVKATRKKENEGSSLQALWKKFLEEKYDGGKTKVQNPNPKTRDRHPEITVNYLMGRSDPVYAQARQGIRREFLEWRRSQR